MAQRTRGLSSAYQRNFGKGGATNLFGFLGTVVVCVGQYGSGTQYTIVPCGVQSLHGTDVLITELIHII